MAELATRAPRILGSELVTLYLGGGTPSRLGGPGLASLVHGILESPAVEGSSTAGGVEITIEANPEDVTPVAVSAWAGAGVSRVSLGVQSFAEPVLRWMHREHSADAAARAVGTLRDGGIQDISLDLIFAVPAGLERDWDDDLSKALALEPSHLSVYGLTVEPRTPLGRWHASGQVQEAPEERYEQEFLRADERLSAAGFVHYEVSNYGRPGHRARHNSAYWSGARYLGLGPAAHGFDGVRRRWNRAAFADWLRAVEQGLDPIAGDESIGPAESAAEAVYIGLRTADGIHIRENEMKTVTRWVEEGWASMAGSHLSLTPAGWLRLDALAAVLTSLRSHS